MAFFFKNFLLLVLSFFISTSLNGQKYDYQWFFGYADTSVFHPEFGRSVIDFNTSPPEVYYENQQINFDATGVTICDTSGNLLFYTNGIVVANHLHEIMENGSGLNPGNVADGSEFWGYRNIQGALVLPLPESDSIFYLIHQRIEYPNPNISVHGSTLFLTQIDMGKNNGLGKVISKNEAIINDILETGNLTATRHANGRDWWILHGKFDSNEFYTLLLTPDGLENQGIQEVGILAPTGLGQAVFSPDGSKYAKLDLVSISAGNFLNIYDFDRCTGELDNHIQIMHPDSAGAGGLAISPNSRYLYVPSQTLVYQYDLWASDIESTKDTVAIYDGYTDSTGLASTFFMAQLAPNGKIYINASNGVKELHVINSPDSAGVACDLQQHSLLLPTFNKLSLPNFPNYRLGALEDSPCDTLETATINPLLENTELSLYPNPAQDILTIEWESISTKSTFNLTNSIGQTVLSQELLKQKKQSINFSLPNGIYFYSIFQNGILIKSGEIIITPK